MKPINLEIKNIGPFVGTHRVDFSILDNIYIISGKTGAGKTTILDCITYALYGKLPGNRSNADRRHLRSDYCSTEDLSTIQFEFSLNEKNYRVERRLPYNKITKRGTQSEENESAILYSVQTANKPERQELFSDSENLTIIESQKSQVDEAIENLLLLSIDEFTRIVLLPQGEFATFLKQNSKERKGLLLKLFPIDQFTRIAERIKEKKTQLDASLKEVTTQVYNLKESINPDTAEKEKETFEKEQNTVKANIDTVQKKLSDLLIEKNTLLEAINRFESFKILEKSLIELQERNAEMQALENKVQNSAEAEKIAPIINNYNLYCNELEKNTIALEDSKAKLEIFIKDQNGLEDEKKEQMTNIARLSILDVLLHDLDRAINVQNEIDESEKELHTTSNKLLDCKTQIEKIHENDKDYKTLITNESNIQETYEQAVLQEKVLSYEILLCNDASLAFLENSAKIAYENAKLLLDDITKQIEKEKLLNLAYGLQNYLESGKECPLCGSLEHPKPLKQNTEMLDNSEKLRLQGNLVNQAEEALRKYQKERNILQGTINEKKTALTEHVLQEKVYSNMDECAEQVKILEDKHKIASATLLEGEKNIQLLKSAKEKTVENDSLIKVLSESEIGINLELAKLHSKIDEKKSDLNAILEKANIEVSSIQNQVESVKNEKKQLTEKTEDYSARKKENENGILILTEKITHIESTIAISSKNKISSQNELIDNIKKSQLFNDKKESIDSKNIFGYIETITKSLMDASEKLSAQNNITSYNTEYLKVQTLYDSTKKELKGSEDEIQKRQIEVQDKIETYTIEQEKLHSHFSHLQQQISMITTLFSEYEAVEKRRKEIEDNCTQYTKLHNVISGNNPKKIPLDSWILGMYLQEITMYANSRLKRMSNGRYQLHLKQDAEGGNAFKGLDLEIYDDHTGKRRPTATLSGGETFITSISLALAISDMVQAQNGGVQLDSMFIDEGFGSLDPESLEKALTILDEIRETRTIALISHVDTLQQRIPSQIFIEKSVSGSTIKICNTVQ